MTVPIPLNDQSSLRRSDARTLSRHQRNLEVQSSMQSARLRSAAEIQAQRTDALIYVAKRGMQNVALLSRLEASLAAMVPMASGRLATIADITAIAVADVVSDTATRVR